MIATIVKILRTLFIIFGMAVGLWCVLFILAGYLGILIDKYYKWRNGKLSRRWADRTARYFNRKEPQTEKDREYVQKQKEGLANELASIERKEEEKRRAANGEKIRYSLNVSLGDYTYRDWERSSVKVSTFQEDLMQMIERRGLDSTEFYKAALMDRKLFSAIKNNSNYNPSWETAVACCLALKLKKREADALLKKAGFSLSEWRRRDKIITYCIEHYVYDIDTINYILDKAGEKTLMV